MEYFNRLLALLQMEREADRQLYQHVIRNSSVVQRRESGLTWYPVAIRDSEMSRGDYITVEVERTTHTDIPHQLRFGSPAALFSNHDAGNLRADGIISHQSGNRLRLTLRTDELPDWSRDGKLGVDLMFDENSYDEMQQTLRQASTLGLKSTRGLVQVLTGSAKPGFSRENEVPPISELNRSQNEAVDLIGKAEDLAIVHGPPGTGKTTTIVRAIRALLENDPRQILVVAPSNTAVDLLAEKLAELNINVVRIGNPVRVSERLLSLTLDSQMSSHPSMKEIKRLKKQAAEFRTLAHKYKRHFGKAEREQRKALFDEAHRIMKDVEATEQYIIDDVLSRAQVISATLLGANHYTIRNRQYHTVVIDEAGQAIEPACWVPVLKAKKLVMAGDHLQLPPTIKSAEAASSGLAVTLLEKCVRLYPECVVLLEEQYRMHQLIMEYPSTVFYEGRLKANETVKDHVLYPGDRPLTFIDTAGCGFEEVLEGTSIKNPEEAAFVSQYLSILAREIAEHSSDEPPSVAVISPYKQQVLLLQALLASSDILNASGNRFAVNTIDAFQGQERDIVLISLTRSNSESNIGFLSEIRRMNVAITRARKKLIIVGDSATLSQFPFYAGLIAFAEKHGAWQSAWEFMQ